MEQGYNNRNIDNQPSKPKTEDGFSQRVEVVFRKHGMVPKWDYSKVGQTVMIPAPHKKTKEK